VDIYLDDCKAETATAADAALGDLVREVKARLEVSGRILVGIQCDGIDVTGESFGDVLTKAVGAHQRIDMQSADPQALVTEALGTTRELLDVSRQTCGDVVDLLSQGDIESAMPKLGECCQAWAQVHQSICNSVAMLGLDAESVQLEDKSLPELLQVPHAQLEQIKEVVIARDFVLLSDILTYEFSEATQAWEKAIDALSNRA